MQQEEGKQEEDDSDVVANAVASGWVHEDEGGTGDCGYRSLAAAMQFNVSGAKLSQEDCKRQAAVLRAQTVAYLRRHIAEYRNYLRPNRPISPECPAPGERALLAHVRRHE